MLVWLYVLAAAILLWAKHDSTLPPAVVSTSLVFAWIGAGAAVIYDLVMLFVTVTVNMTPPERIEVSLHEEQDAGLLWWWTFPFAGLLITAEWNLLSATAAISAALKWPISVTYLRAARARLAALEPPITKAPEEVGE